MVSLYRMSFWEGRMNSSIPTRKICLSVTVDLREGDGRGTPILWGLSEGTTGPSGVMAWKK